MFSNASKSYKKYYEFDLRSFVNLASYAYMFSGDCVSD
jgi:hypothetical protein